jgi:hypothetical protein
MGKLGMNLGDLKKQLDQEFSGFSFGKTNFPLLFQSGLVDAAIHSAGVSYLLTLGIEFGLPAIAEYPVIVHADNYWKKTPKVMPDSIWFHPQTHQPWIAFEFERFEKGDEVKITNKVKNLALSFHQSNQSIELCVLVFWLRSGIAPRSIDPLIRIFEQGFFLDNMHIPAPKCSFVLYKFIFCKSNMEGAESSLHVQLKDDQGAYSINGASNTNTSLSLCSSAKMQ